MASLSNSLRASNWKESAKTALAYRPLQYALLIGAVLLVVYFIGKKAGKGVTVSYPGSKTADPVTDSFTTTQAPVILTALYDAFRSWGSIDWVTKKAAVDKIINLTDNQLVYIFNQYNQQYLAGKKQTLYTVIEEEWFGLVGAGADIQRDILKRMQQLGMNKLP